MKKIFSSLLAAVSLFSLCACGFVSKAEEAPEQNVQETKAVKDTELVFIIDKSGSMHGLTSDIIGNFNSVIAEQKKDKANGKVYVTTVLFDTVHTKIHDRVDIEEIKEMTDKDYRPSGCTALLDAVGDTLSNLSKIDGIKDRNVIVAIMTDGYENSSKEYTKKQVKERTESAEKAGCKILFFGAGVDAFSDNSGGGIGIRKDRIWSIGCTGADMKCAFGCICNEVTATRAGN